MGALPSGSDPSYVSFPDNYHAFGAALSALATWTQDNVTAQQKSALQSSPGWTGASGTLFNGLDPDLPFPVAFLKALAESLFGSIVAASTMNDLFDAIGVWTNDLNAEIAAGGVAFQTFMSSVWTAVEHDHTWSSLVTDLSAAWETYVTTVTALTSAEMASLQQLITSLTGINWSTGLYDPNKVNGLTDTMDWLNRVIRDLLVLLDVFHITYEAGSSGDAPGHLGTNGKVTWYSAWNDLRVVFGLSAAVSTPTDAAPTIGTAITTAQSTASTAVASAGTAQTTANTASTWSTRLTNALTILFDVFHVVYQAGSPSDPPGHLGTNGKPTWYSAWNDLMALCGVVNSTTAPTDAAPTIGSAINTAQSTANSAGSAASAAQSTATAAGTQSQNLTDAVANAIGIPGTGHTPSSVASPLADNLAQSCFRQYSSDAGPTSQVTAGAYPLVLDTNSYNIGGYLFNTATNTLTVPVKGLYYVRFGVGIKNMSGSVLLFGPTLSQMGTVVRYGSTFSYSSGTVQTGHSVGDSFLIECNANDTLTPGLIKSGTILFGGATSPSGQSYFEVTLVRVDT